MKLPPQYHYVPIIAALLYGLTTPIGIAVGLGVRATYNPDSTNASIVSGVLDALSSGILIYTGLVEVGGIVYSSCYEAEIDFLVTATCTRVHIQQRNDQRLEWQTRICVELYVVRMWYHGSTGSLGLELSIDWKEYRAL